MHGTSKEPSPLCFAGALQIFCSKIKNPVTFCRAKATGWRRDLSRKENSLRPEHLFAGVQKLLSVQAGLLALFIASKTGDELHSGATARDSHPLPYSPQTVVWGTDRIPKHN